MTDDELLASFDQSLTTLTHLAQTHDDGYHPICLAMATEVHKILAGNGSTAKLRGTRVFLTVDFGEESEMLNAMHKLVGARVTGAVPALDFIPDFQFGQDITNALKFGDWWNTDVIYCASAAIPGDNPGVIPINASPLLPFDKRQTINRRDFVSLLRNKRGAHQDDDMPQLLDELETSRSWGVFECQTPAGVLSTLNDTLLTGASMMAAMMRQIVHEVLLAYGRAAPPALVWEVEQ
ncbi:hypothetical protein EAH76_16805 [Sphingomonas glacialis]|uniref:Uncharacterized protein n=2 Tax=Sphingomonas glacialis TaxID=658225 RepID=A0A502FRM0_9SPHN|nr:hypothetical protein EAH76_16805 [Sphingomonas glacialis]